MTEAMLMVELPESVVRSIVTENGPSYADWPVIVEGCKESLPACRCAHRMGDHLDGGACRNKACGCQQFRKKGES